MTVKQKSSKPLPPSSASAPLDSAEPTASSNPAAADFHAFWTKTATELQQNLQSTWQTAAQKSSQQLNQWFESQSPMAAAPAASLPAMDWTQLQEIQQAYLKEASALLQAKDGLSSGLKDKRFGTEAWRNNLLAASAAEHYLLQSRTLMRMVETIQADEKTKAQLRFATQQWLDANAPSNFLALNADALQKALSTKGESIAKGLQNLLQDMAQGQMSQTDTTVFEVGKNVATSEGAVVFENELFQLIEYKPLTDKVFERPFLLIPPCINKFYILDLQPANSLIRYCVEQGHRTFVLSWRNPDASMDKVTWDDYVEKAAIKAIDTVQRITKSEQINALGFCVGGTILVNALAVLAARGQGGSKSPVASATFLTTLIDFGDTGVLDVFIDENFVKLRELQFAAGGLLPGRDLATTFSFLRPNELVWNYVVGNYLKGESPPPFDLLYWNGDSTNLPGPMYAWYLRNTYLENRLVQPARATVCGEKIDLRKVDLPVYIYGSREDHIVPIGVNGGGAYASTQHLPGPKRFVMGASGHIAGVINPPAANKRSHWLRPDNEFPTTQAQWLAGAEERPGSWWPDWAAWLKTHAGKQKPAPKQYGDKTHKVLEPAPGRYVKAKA